MKKFFTKPITLEKLEFWVACGVYGFAMFFIAMTLYNINPGVITDTPNRYDFDNHRLPYSYVSNFFLPLALEITAYFLCFSFLNFYVINNLIAKRYLALNIISIPVSLILLIAALTISNRYYHADLFAHVTDLTPVWHLLLKNNILVIFILTIVFVFYTLVKYVLLALAKNIQNINYKISPVLRDAIVAFSIWGIVLILLNARGMPDGPRICWVMIFMYSILLYLVSFYKIIPYVKKKKLGFKGYALRFSILVLVVLLQVAIVTIFIFENSYEFGVLVLFNVVAQLMVVMPGVWIIYNYKYDTVAEITGLKTALGSSSANLDMLRSQINPHFLFNSLNTLYGTALQEGAERTGEGIQKLGDMMRLMLHENLQDSILLVHEVDYLKNYITLQKLRTQSSPDIIIETAIDEQPADLHIAPMLLIPFIENAFKHGISLQTHSFIKISLHTVDGILYFDVQNSIHIKPENDPEKYSTGIGLTNVEERLKLLYPHKYELSIHETAKEFFVHLTINLL